MARAEPAPAPCGSDPEGRWLLLEPYYGGSHRHLADGLADRLPWPVDLWTLPPRKWKWRMRGAALAFTRRWALERPDPRCYVGIITSSLLDVAALRGLLPTAARDLPMIVYCHENQLDYPVQVDDKRDYHYAWTNIQSLLAADLVLWNSRYNRDSFLDSLPGFVSRLPDHRPAGIGEAVAGRSRVLPVPFDAAALAAESSSLDGPRPPRCRIVWNHRWEHDKGPEAFFAALFGLATAGHDFEVAVLGQQFDRRPAVFATARDRLGDRIVAWGHQPRAEYVRQLSLAEVAVSTALHEFQGLAILEAAACGAVPLVPDRLAYPELWPEELRYADGELESALAERIEHRDRWRRWDLSDRVMAYDWEALLPLWVAALSDAASAAGRGAQST